MHSIARQKVMNLEIIPTMPTSQMHRDVNLDMSKASNNIFGQAHTYLVHTDDCYFPDLSALACGCQGHQQTREDCLSSFYRVEAPAPTNRCHNTGGKC